MGTPTERVSPPTVTVELDYLVELHRDAESWRALMRSPHVRELLAEWIEWRRRSDLRESSHAISQAVDWRAIANAPSYAELQRRRNSYAHEPLSPPEIGRWAAESWQNIEGRNAA